MNEMRDISTMQQGRQQYDAYSREDHKVWEILYNNQQGNIGNFASQAFQVGLETVGFRADEIPNFTKINDLLQKSTGWELVAVKGIVDDAEFFQLMSERKFPATTWIRRMDQLEYLEEPDMFHDVYAHVPLLTNQHFADFLHALSGLSLSYIYDPVAIDLLSRVYWYTVEFGLINEGGSLKIYGAGILSSEGETRYSVSPAPMHFQFNVEQLLNSPYRKDEYQSRYFIIDTYEQLYHSLSDIREGLKAILSKKQLLA